MKGLNCRILEPVIECAAASVKQMEWLNLKCIKLRETNQYGYKNRKYVGFISKNNFVA